MKVLIDNGHGDPPLTGGKCSPDRRLKEYHWVRDIAQRLERRLSLAGIDCIRITPEAKDITLTERIRRVNSWCNRLGNDNCILISIHVNAAPGNGWSDASGWSGWIAKSASAKSRQLAQDLYDCADKAGLRGNRYVPPQRYWESNFAIVTKTRCPAVLTENGFMTNRQEVDYLLSEEGKRTIVDIHFNGILKFLNRL